MDITDLAREIADQHGIDGEAAIRVVQVHTDQISDDPDLYSIESGLTDDGADLIREAIRESYRIGANATTASLLLEQIEDAAREAQEHATRRDELIRRAMTTELRRADIAAAAGVTVARLHQIKDGR